MFPWYIKYPNQNDEILNLDWILSTIENLVKETDNFINLNTIKYADPILWDITSQYEANTIVVDPQTGDAYISTKAVPYGVHLDNTGYWTKIYNYADAINTLQEQIAAANEKLSTTATAPRNVGDLVWLNGILHTITATMIAGDSYVEGSNCREVTIEELLAIIRTNLAAETETRAEADEALGERITSEAEARSEADEALGDRVTAEAEARAEADANLQEEIDNITFGNTRYNVETEEPEEPEDSSIYEVITDDIALSSVPVTSASEIAQKAINRIAEDTPNYIFEIVSYNTENENGVYRNLLNGAGKYGDIKKALMSFGCDIAVLQEDLTGSLFNEEALIKSNLMRNYVTANDLLLSPLIYQGISTLSYENIVGTTYTKFTNRVKDEGLLKTTYNINGRSLAVYNVHIYYVSGSIQDAQWDEMLSILNADTTPYRIIGGDLNVNLATYPKVATFENAGYKVLNKGEYITYPPSNIAVDGFICTPNINALNIEVIDNGYTDKVISDHLPIKARLQLV